MISLQTSIFRWYILITLWRVILFVDTAHRLFMSRKRICPHLYIIRIITDSLVHAHKICELCQILAIGILTLNVLWFQVICLLCRFGEVLPEYCLVVWGCCMPMGENVRGGFMDPGMQWQQETLRLDILEANYFASIIAESHNYDVIDFHWFFRCVNTVWSWSVPLCLWWLHEFHSRLKV